MGYALIGIVLVVVLGAGLVLFFRSLAEERVRAAQADVRRLRIVLDDVKEVAWSHRELAPDLSTIIIDTIRTAERDHRPELPG